MDCKGKLLRQKLNGSTQLEFLYGKEGLLGFIYNGADYLYQKNLLGDIVKIIDSTGTVVGEYSYTAFGECTVITNVNNIAYANPMRYRGYYYEADLELYYLKTRFYNPETGRFISQDNLQYLQPDVINGLNLFAYCGNNPIMNIDTNGNRFKSVLEKFLYKFSQAEAIFSSLVNHIPKDVSNKAKKFFSAVNIVSLIAKASNSILNDYRNNKTNREIFTNASTIIAKDVIIDWLSVGAGKLASFIPYVGVIAGPMVTIVTNDGLNYIINETKAGEYFETAIETTMEVVYDVGEGFVKGVESIVTEFANLGKDAYKGVKRFCNWIFG